MYTFYYLLSFLLLSDVQLCAMQKTKEEGELLSGQSVRRLKVFCGTSCTRCIPATCGLFGVVFLCTALYVDTHPPQECLASSGPFIDVSDSTDISGKSFDVYVQNCGICPQEVMPCNYPIEGITTARQLTNRAAGKLNTTCGSSAVYQIKVNVVPKADPLASLRMPGNQAKAFFSFDDQHKAVKAKCNARRPLAKSPFKKRGR